MVCGVLQQWVRVGPAQISRRTYRVKEIVAVPIPSAKQLCRVALILSPCIAIGERRIDGENRNSNGKEADSCSLADSWVLPQTQSAEPVARKIIHLTERENGEIESGQVVMQEQLTRHQEEGEVMEGPSENAHTHFVIEALEGDIIVITEAALPSNDGKTFDRDVKYNDCGSAPPDDGVP